MWFRPGGGIRHRRTVRLVAAALYGLVLIAASFEHHDLLCHLQHPQHCTACRASELGSDPQTLAVPRTFQLADVGRAITVHLTAAGALLPVRSTGRSPPLVG
jgi:hypothetical protein